MQAVVLHVFLALVQAQGGYVDAFGSSEACLAARTEYIDKHKETLLAVSDCAPITLVATVKPDDPKVQPLPTAPTKPEEAPTH